MRPRFRASTVVYAARYAPTADALGSMQPGYAAARHALRGTLRVAALERYPLHLRARLEKEAAHGA